MTQYFSVNAFMDDALDAFDEQTRGVKIAGLHHITVNHRVDTGRMQGNWQISQGAPTYRDRDVLDKTGSFIKSEITSVVSNQGATYLSNNLDYAPKWNEVDGYVERAALHTKNLTRGMKKPS